MVALPSRHRCVFHRSRERIRSCPTYPSSGKIYVCTQVYAVCIINVVLVSPTRVSRVSLHEPDTASETKQKTCIKYQALWGMFYTGHMDRHQRTNSTCYQRIDNLAVTRVKRLVIVRPFWLLPPIKGQTIQRINRPKEGGLGIKVVRLDPPLPNPNYALYRTALDSTAVARDRQGANYSRAHLYTSLRRQFRVLIQMGRQVVRLGLLQYKHIDD